MQDCLKGRVHCFSMLVVMNNCFLLTLKKISIDSSCHFEKNVPLILKDDVIEPKARLLYLPVNFRNHGFRKSETDI